MRRISNFAGPGAALVLALALSGCSTVSDAVAEGKWLPKISSPLKSSDLQFFGGSQNTNVTRPVSTEDMIDAAGYCVSTAPQPAVAAAAPPEVPAAPPPPPPPQAPADGPMVLTPGAVTPPPPPNAPRTVAASDPAVAVAPPAAPAQTAPLEPGGIALQMTECQVVRRAGHPERFEIGTDAHGERKVVLTYIRGERPGIYHFVAGRLKEIMRAPEPPRPPPKQKRKRRSKRRA